VLKLDLFLLENFQSEKTTQAMDKKESLIISACLLGAFLLSFSMLKAMYHQMASVTDNREAPLLESHIVSFSDGHGDTVESQSLYRTFKYENVIHFSQSQREPANPPPRERQLDISNLESSDDWKLYIQNLQNSDSEERGHFTACELKHLYRAVDRRVERSAGVYALNFRVFSLLPFSFCVKMDTSRQTYKTETMFEIQCSSNGAGTLQSKMGRPVDYQSQIPSNPV